MYNRDIIAFLISFNSFGTFADITAKKEKYFAEVFFLSAFTVSLVWPFEGILGTFDRQTVQRGAQVYFKVCSTCYRNHNLYYRKLKDLGFSEGAQQSNLQKKIHS